MELAGDIDPMPAPIAMARIKTFPHGTKVFNHDDLSGFTVKDTFGGSMFCEDRADAYPTAEMIDESLA